VVRTEFPVSKIQDDVLKSLFNRLGESDDVPPHVVERLQTALTAATLPKADAVVRILSTPASETA
jgi:hypothetical protein